MNRELDVWISENLFKELVHPRTNEIYCRTYGGNGSIIESFIPVPNYTSDMNEAVKIITRLFDTYEDEYLGISLDYSQGLWRLGEDGPVVEGNPAMAICLYAYETKTGKSWFEEKESDK